MRLHALIIIEADVMNAQGKAAKPRQHARQTEKAPPAKRSKVARNLEDDGAKETVAEKDKVSLVGCCLLCRCLFHRFCHPPLCVMTSLLLPDHTKWRQ